MTKFSGEIKGEGSKRTYVDIQVQTDCPKCGNKCVADFDENYMSHPVVGGDVDVYFYCDNCDHEFLLNAKIIDMSVTIDVDMENIVDA